jgi:hypothetical protein
MKRGSTNTFVSSERGLRKNCRNTVGNARCGVLVFEGRTDFKWVPSIEGERDSARSLQ